MHIVIEGSATATATATSHILATTLSETCEQTIPNIRGSHVVFDFDTRSAKADAFTHFSTHFLSVDILFLLNPQKIPLKRQAMSLKRKAADIVAADAKKPKANGSITSFFGPPKPKPATSSTANPSADPSEQVPEPVSAAFDKAKWVGTLTEEQKQLLRLEIETLHESWLSVLKDEITSKEFISLKKFLKSEAESGKKIFPPSEDVYSWYGLKHRVHHVRTELIKPL